MIVETMATKLLSFFQLFGKSSARVRNIASSFLLFVEPKKKSKQTKSFPVLTHPQGSRFCLLLLACLQTLTAPNSWAAVSLWRRFFQLQEEQEEEQRELMEQALEETLRHTNGVAPLYHPEVVASIREQAVAEYYRDLIRQGEKYSRSVAATPSTAAAATTGEASPSLAALRHEMDRQILQQPNLAIPMNDHESMYLPQ